MEWRAQACDKDESMESFDTVADELNAGPCTFITKPEVCMNMCVSVFMQAFVCVLKTLLTGSPEL